MTTRSKTVNRLLSLALCICMVLSLMPGISLVADAATATKIYLQPNSNWTQANARFAAYFFGNGEKWVSMTDSNGDGIYEVDVPSGFPSVIFCRMNPSATANNWDNRWNQSGDLKVPTDSKTLFTVKSGTWDGATTSWGEPSCDYAGHYFDSNNTCTRCKKGICLINGHTFENEVCTICGTAGRTVYFQNNWLWSDVKLYYWKGEFNNTWPGEAVDYYGEAVVNGETRYYSVMVVPADVEGFIISGTNNDNSALHDQTVTITLDNYYDGITYYIDSHTVNDQGNHICDVKDFPICKDFPVEHKFENDECTRCKEDYCRINGHQFGSGLGKNDACTRCGDPSMTIFFKSSWGWTDVCLHDWYDGTDVNNGWPGEKMSVYSSSQSGSGSITYYYLKVPTDIAGINVNGLKTVGDSSVRDQSPDILIGELYNGACIEMAWDSVNEKNSYKIFDINDVYQCILGHTEKVIPGHDATCTVDGLTDGIVCQTCGQSLKEQEVIPASGHGDNDKNGRCDSCSCLMAPAQLMKISASLEGNIAVNYYMLLSEEVLADQTAYMQFKLVDGEIRKIPVSEGVKMVVEGETYYVYSCAVNAKEMTDDIISQFFYADTSTREHPYNIQTYAKHILADYDDEATRNLIVSMLNYGTAAQIHFGYNTDKLANAILETAPDYSNVTIDRFSVSAGQGTELAKFYSASLILKSETTVRFFFTGAITATYNGQPLEVKQRSGRYYVDVVGISAKALDEKVTITINDGTDTADVSFNPMSYCQGVWNDTTGAFDADLKNLVCALYLYNQAANVYFKEI